jgi:hypothetical protein
MQYSFQIYITPQCFEMFHFWQDIHHGPSGPRGSSPTIRPHLDYSRAEIAADARRSAVKGSVARWNMRKHSTGQARGLLAYSSLEVEG